VRKSKADPRLLRRSLLCVSVMTPSTCHSPAS
jgi:hypothetical protein